MNETDYNINNMNDSEVTCPDITSPAFMMQCEDKNTLMHLIMKQKPAWIFWISKQKNSHRTHPQLLWRNVEINNIITTRMKLIQVLIP